MTMLYTKTMEQDSQTISFSNVSEISYCAVGGSTEAMSGLSAGLASALIPSSSATATATLVGRWLSFQALTSNFKF